MFIAILNGMKYWTTISNQAGGLLWHSYEGRTLRERFFAQLWELLLLAVWAGLGRTQAPAPLPANTTYITTSSVAYQDGSTALQVQPQISSNSVHITFLVKSHENVKYASTIICPGLTPLQLHGGLTAHFLLSLMKVE